MSWAIERLSFSFPPHIYRGYLQDLSVVNGLVPECRTKKQNQQDICRRIASINVNFCGNSGSTVIEDRWWMAPYLSTPKMTKSSRRESLHGRSDVISLELAPFGADDHRVLDPASAISGRRDITAPDTFEELEQDRPRHPCVVYNHLAVTTPYHVDWEWQKKVLDRLAAKADDLSEPDVVLLTQHDEVFTLGTGSTLENLKFSLSDPPFEVVRTERGGEVTYHGPGQIVMYPIMNLRRYRKDIHWYLRALEETVIRTLSKLGLIGERVEGLTGVWVEGRKVAAVGVRVKRWVTMHGLSINVRPDLEHFRHIVPCGIDDRPVGSIQQLCADDQDITIDIVAALLLASFEEVFGVQAKAGQATGPHEA